MSIRTFLIVSILGVSASLQSAFSQFVAISDDFSTAGNLSGSAPDSGEGTWASISGAGPVASGGALAISAASGSAAQLNFSASNLNSGTVYLGFDFRISSSGSLNTSATISAFSGFRSGTAASGSYVWGLGAFRPNGAAQSGSGLMSTSTSQFYAGIFSGAGQNAESTPLVAWSNPLDRGVSYRAVLGFDLTNDVARLWINPESSGASSIALSSITGSTRGIFVREGSASHGAVSFDNLNVSLDFNSAAGLSAIPEPSTYAAILGLVSLVGAIVYRRRRNG